jgi:hypothetical protein
MDREYMSLKRRAEAALKAGNVTTWRVDEQEGLTHAALIVAWFTGGGAYSDVPTERVDTEVRRCVAALTRAGLRAEVDPAGPGRIFITGQAE